MLIYRRLATGERFDYTWDFSSTTCEIGTGADHIAVVFGLDDSHACSLNFDEFKIYDSDEAATALNTPDPVVDSVDYIDYYGLQLDRTLIATKMDLFFFSIAINPTSEGDVFLFMSNNFMTQFFYISTPDSLTICMVWLFGLFGPLDIANDCLVL